MLKIYLHRMILLKISLSSPTIVIIHRESNLIILRKTHQFEYKRKDTKGINRVLFLLIAFQKKIRYISNVDINLDNIVNIDERI